MKRYLIAAAYIASIIAANWAIQHLGDAPKFPGGPHTLPVWPGIDAPSGVYFVGLMLVLRDLVQRAWGAWATLGLIVAAAGLVALISPSLALASTLAFLASEVVDWAVFTPLQGWSLRGAVITSNLASIVVDSFIFLTVAFGSLAYIDGQIIGKLLGTVAGLVVLEVIATRERVATT